MSTSPAAVHSVHIYDENADLISRLCGIVSSSLRVGDAVLIVATAQHREQLVKSLEYMGINVRDEARAGRYTMIDAAEMLSTFIVDGMPDPDLFRASMGYVLRKVKKAACIKTTGLTVFGEMVAILWNAGSKAAALRLEDLWNETLQYGAFNLHCAYPRCGFLNEADEASVCRTHSHVVH